MANRYRFIRSAIRNLKRRYGQNIRLTRMTTVGTTDFTSGKTSGNETEIKKIRRAIVLPSRLKRGFTYDLSFIAANKNFTYGGFYDVAQRTIILDNKDIGSFIVNVDTNLMIGETKYKIKEVNSYEEGRATILIVVELKGER